MVIKMSEFELLLADVRSLARSEGTLLLDQMEQGRRVRSDGDVSFFPSAKFSEEDRERFLRAEEEAAVTRLRQFLIMASRQETHSS